MGKFDKWLEEGWRECWKWLSVQVSFLAGIAVAIYDLIPSIQDIIPEGVFRIVMGVMFLLVIIGRLKKQE